MITVSAPGKIHLMGEHAVVYGKPALLSAINMRLRVSVMESKQQSHEIHVEDPDAQAFILHAVDITTRHFKLTAPPFLDISVQSDIPFGYHLGSSASLAVATVGAVSYFLKKLWNPIEINQLAYEVEKKQHGNPSGGDNTAVTFGGFVWYRKELEFLKSMWQLPFRPAKNLNHFFLINTGKPEETTGEMVQKVSVTVKKHPREMEKVFSENEIQTKLVALALKEGNEDQLIQAIQKGEQTLEAMGVVSDHVRSLIRLIEQEKGAVKILGGGGQKGAVGFLLCYHHVPEKIEHLCKQYGYSIQRIELGEEGVRLEKK